MKRIINNKTNLLLLAGLLAGSVHLSAQDTPKKELVVTVNYYMTDNKEVYLRVNMHTKLEKKVEPVVHGGISLYLDSTGENNLIAKVKTNEEGNAKAFLPPVLKTAWESAATHKFIAVSDASKEFEETEAEASVTKAKITIDTTSDGETRSITAHVSYQDGTEWVPAPDVEMKVGISRLGGILSAGDDPTYTTDSSGSVTVEVTKDSLPGDEKGNIMLAAKVDNNELYGTLLVEKSVPWGVSFRADNNFFNQRTLWSTRNRTPPWLLFMAYSIVLGVWGTIVYLLGQLLKIKKLSKGSTSS